jgi:hypothetical protein
MWRSTKALSLTLMVMASAGLWGCSSDGQDPTQSNAESGSLTFAPNPELAIPGGGSRVKGENACRRATAGVGANPEVVESVAHCSGQKRDNVVFILQRFSFEDPAETLGIKGYNPEPVVRGEGTVAKAGECLVDQEILVCKAKIDGPVAISGHLSVRPDTRCEGAVSLVGITSPPCEGKHCEGDPILDELFSAKPKGCAA